MIFSLGSSKKLHLGIRRGALSSDEALREARRRLLGGAHHVGSFGHWHWALPPIIHDLHNSQCSYDALYTHIYTYICILMYIC